MTRRRQTTPPVPLAPRHRRTWRSLWRRCACGLAAPCVDSLVQPPIPPFPPPRGRRAERRAEQGRTDIPLWSEAPDRLRAQSSGADEVSVSQPPGPPGTDPPGGLPHPDIRRAARPEPSQVPWPGHRRSASATAECPPTPAAGVGHRRRLGSFRVAAHPRAVQASSIWWRPLPEAGPGAWPTPAAEDATTPVRTDP